HSQQCGRRAHRTFHPLLTPREMAAAKTPDRSKTQPAWLREHELPLRLQFEEVQLDLLSQESSLKVRAKIQSARLCQLQRGLVRKRSHVTHANAAHLGHRME